MLILPSHIATERFGFPRVDFSKSSYLRCKNPWKHHTKEHSERSSHLPSAFRAVCSYSYSSLGAAGIFTNAGKNAIRHGAPRLF